MFEMRFSYTKQRFDELEAVDTQIKQDSKAAEAAEKAKPAPSPAVCFLFLGYLFLYFEKRILFLFFDFPSTFERL